MDVLYGNRIGKKGAMLFRCSPSVSSYPIDPFLSFFPHACTSLALHANTAAMFLRKMTIAQGKKYDDPNSRRDIEPFIKVCEKRKEGGNKG